MKKYKKLLTILILYLLLLPNKACLYHFESDYIKQIKNKMVYIKTGSFIIGDGKYNNNKPHEVTLSSFYIGKYEVTQKEYQVIMGSNPSFFKGENLPVESVSWFDAIKFCNILSKRAGLPLAYKEDTCELLDSKGNSTEAITDVKGYRLPTEAEWEFVATSRGKPYKYSWGTGDPYINGKKAGNISDKSTKKKYIDWIIWNGYDDGYQETSPVGSFEPNELGVYDLTGNVNEWCTDWFDEEFYKYSNNVNPVNSISSVYKVRRGGGWSTSPNHLSVSSRYINTPNFSFSTLGFRLAKTP